MKKIAAVFLVLCLSFVMVFSVAAETSTDNANAKATNIYLEYSKKEIKKGSTLKVDLKIKDNQGFGTFTTRIGFNNKKLKLTGIENKYEPKNYGNLHLDSSVDIANTNSWYKIGWTPTPVSPEKTSELVTFNGIYARFIFTCLEDQIPNVEFFTVTLYSNDLAMTDLPYKLFSNDQEVSEIYAATGDNVSMLNSKINKNYEASDLAEKTSAAESDKLNQTTGSNGNTTGSNLQNNQNSNSGLSKTIKEKPWIVVIILFVTALVVCGAVLFISGKKGKAGKHEKQNNMAEDNEEI